MKIYIAAPLFNEMEKKRNCEIDDLLQSIGFSTYLPQRDGGDFAELSKKYPDPGALQKKIFESDVKAVKECDILLFLLDGRVPDEGACFELGMAHILDKICIGFKNDARNFSDGQDNLMLVKSLKHLVNTTDDLVEILNSYTVATVQV